jgi:hypothetical protein
MQVREIDKVHENSILQSSCGFPLQSGRRIFIEDKIFVFWSGGYKYIKRVQCNHISSWLIDENHLVCGRYSDHISID